MTDWSSLKHAYGPAADVPDILTELANDPQQEIWQELWGCLCHDGTVYSASFAVLPKLLEIGSRWPQEQRLELLALAGAILASSDVHGPRDAFIQGLEPIISGFRKPAGECLGQSGWSRLEFVYILQSACTF